MDLTAPATIEALAVRLHEDAATAYDTMDDARAAAAEYVGQIAAERETARTATWCPLWFKQPGENWMQADKRWAREQREAAERRERNGALLADTLTGER